MREHAHLQSFGPRLEEGGVRFRLWAPGARGVEVALAKGGTDRFVPMEAARRGWFECFVPGAGPGTLYQFRIDGDALVPDPASRCQPEDVLGPSLVVDPAAYSWKNHAWNGRPWHEVVLYELHVGTFSPEGTYAGVRSRLEHLEKLGVTALELMPVSDFSGARGWGYDGVYAFAPDAAYGTPEQLKRLIDEAHGRGLMVFLDVVYNHFGPQGNFLGLYAPEFFTEAHQTPWGAAIDFTVREVRDFFIENALYWLTEFRFDGLRLDAVHAIRDESPEHILEELARTVRAALPEGRQVHLVLENDANLARFLAREQGGTPRFYAAQWNDDLHHVLHVLATGESQGYYQDYAGKGPELLARCLAEGFAYQGEPSAHRAGARRGEPSAHLPPTAFVAFLQNHDQIGNRALGERLALLAPEGRLEALTAILLLGPQIPLLFMGEEWGCRRPFPFFCDFEGDLAEAVRKGRLEEFAGFPEFADPETRARIPDPCDPATAAGAVLDWHECAAPDSAARLTFVSELLALRRERIVPLLPALLAGEACGRVEGAALVRVAWPLAGGGELLLLANLADDPARLEASAVGPGSTETLYALPHLPEKAGRDLLLAPWSVWLLCSK